MELTICTKIVIVVFLFANIANGFVCYEEYCANLKCPKLNCTSKQELVILGGTCQCCDVCFNLLGTYNNKL